MPRPTKLLGVLAGIMLSVSAAFGQADPNGGGGGGGPGIDPQLQSQIQQMRDQFVQRMQETGTDPQQIGQSIMQQMQNGTFSPQAFQQQLIDGGFVDPGLLNQVGQRVQQIGGQQSAAILRSQLAASDEEWSVLGPKIQRVLSLIVELRLGNATQTSALSFGAFGGGNSIMGVTAPPNNPVAKAMADLKAALEQTDTPDPVVMRCLTTLRQEIEKARDELAIAQKDLSEVSTLRQEAVLMLVGIID